MYYLSVIRNLPVVGLGSNQGPAQIGAPVTTCDAATATASVFVLQTALGVNYDAGHWFHVAENFMAQHSLVCTVFMTDLFAYFIIAPVFS